jgi:hypothetical protein
VLPTLRGWGGRGQGFQFCGAIGKKGERRKLKKFQSFFFSLFALSPFNLLPHFMIEVDGALRVVGAHEMETVDFLDIP